MTISGSVDSPRDAERLKAAARQFLGDKETINFDVAVNMATQVTLRVQVAEVSRNVDKELGVTPTSPTVQLYRELRVGESCVTPLNPRPSFR